MRRPSPSFGLATATKRNSNSNTHCEAGGDPKDRETAVFFVYASQKDGTPGCADAGNGNFWVSRLVGLLRTRFQLLPVGIYR